MQSSRRGSWIHGAHGFVTRRIVAATVGTTLFFCHAKAPVEAATRAAMSNLNRDIGGKEEKDTEKRRTESGVVAQCDCRAAEPSRCDRSLNTKQTPWDGLRVEKKDGRS